MLSEHEEDYLVTRRGAARKRRAYSPAEAAAELGISRSHLYRLRNEGLIKFSKLLGRTLITESEIDRVVATLEEEAK
ncbi:helix-turn-helix domain-containing protein [Cucumibacter marinus]|uniref:helix-turn-helix domain-containing protein n=1 Tax=Cucumibacter marinus TaxID=1121252 RepID=UPI0005681884|nr:helix-turn-helix domain-containing protein [Cucumibacter marinus]